ncbi:MAG: hypothetical protein RIC15_09745 [Vicingaceae bacterium]
MIPIVGVAQEIDDFDYVSEDENQEIEPSRSGVSLPIKGQSEDNFYVIPSYYTNDRGDDLEALSESNESVVDEPNGNNTSVNLQVGSSFSSDFKGNSTITAYVAPHIRHRISRDLAISGGVIMSQTYFNGWTNYSLDGSAFPSSLYRTTLYASLEYQLNERVLLYGTVYQNLTSMPDAFGHGNQLEGLGYSIGMDYKISDRSFLQIQVSRGSGSYNPFMPGGMRGGLGSNPFSYFP